MNAILARLRFVPIAGVAIATFLLLRAHVCEWYLVPSPSMEPTLHGDPRTGDLVLVDKTAFWTTDPKPWDMVVVRGGREGQIVKRLVCLAGPHGGAVALRGGDVFVGPDERSLTRLAKDPVADRDLRITHFEFGPTTSTARGEELLRGARRDASGWHVEPAAITQEALRALLTDTAHAERRRGAPDAAWLPAHLSTAHEVDLSFVDGRGALHQEQGHYDRDIGMELELVPEAGCRALQLVFEHHDVYRSFLYGADGTVAFARAGTVLATTQAPPLVAGATVSLAFGHLDGRFFLTVGDRTILLKEEDLPEAQFERPYPGLHFENLLHVGAAGGGVRVVSGRVFRDLWYRAAPLALVRLGEPVWLEPGEMFLLGDNTFDSLDSRMRGEAQFRRADLLGRPRGILAPRQRVRWFPR